MAKIGIFYGSTDGNTERVVTQIQTLLGGEPVAALHNVNSASADDMQPYSYLILACPTWEIGQLQEDWDSFIDELQDVDYTGKKVAYVGLGDADGYPDTFIDAPGIINDRIKDKGVTVVGQWPTEGYNFEASKGVVDGKFLGLVIDEENQKDLTAGRIEKWVGIIKPEFQ
ncbi:MAG: flavodoxin [Flammeovirgaceae bacterium]|nr:flavodoxin [Flammeovirgaceae bacterium]